VSVLVLDKPSGPTSFGVVRRVKGMLARLWGWEAARGLRVGHGGTLDPLASGVLPICIGEATKLAPFLLEADKEYEAGVRFGVETDTLDAAGVVVRRAPTAGLDEEAVRGALTRFLGPIEQVPPMYSALKRAGRPLHEYARAGEELDRAPRRVVVFSLEVLAWQPPDTLQLRVRCSKGTYVRALAADLGRALGPGAHLQSLRRTASGPFQLAQAIPLEDLQARVDAGAALPLVPLAEALVHLPVATAAAPVALALTQGKRVPADALGMPGSQATRKLRVLREDGSLLAVAEEEGPWIRPLRVFARVDVPPPKPR
jgi:tRNA pseudouridine55 synthase